MLWICCTSSAVFCSVPWFSSFSSTSLILASLSVRSWLQIKIWVKMHYFMTLLSCRHLTEYNFSCKFFFSYLRNLLKYIWKKLSLLKQPPIRLKTMTLTSIDLLCIKCNKRETLGIFYTGNLLSIVKIKWWSPNVNRRILRDLQMQI